MKKVFLLAGIALMGVALNAGAAEAVCTDSPVAVTVGVNPEENWDKVLSDFDKAVNDYVKAKKKSNNTPGEASRLSALKKKVDKLKKKLEGVEEKLTPAQLKRYNKSLQKLASVEE